MTINANTLVFFDASCLVAASGSPTGGSGFLLDVCARGLLQAAVSQPVLIEAERNVIEQLRPQALSTFHRIVATTPWIIVPLPPRRQRRQYERIAGQKDEHVLAAAIESGAQFLLLLDKPFQQGVSQSGLPIRALSPGEFITTVLIEHEDYPSIR
jgi:predicted nucleic acid-binding protein